VSNKTPNPTTSSFRSLILAVVRPSSFVHAPWSESAWRTRMASLALFHVRPKRRQPPTAGHEPPKPPHKNSSVLGQSSYDVDKAPLDQPSWATGRCACRNPPCRNGYACVVSWPCTASRIIARPMSVHPARATRSTSAVWLAASKPLAHCRIEPAAHTTMMHC
jgi:hypothetical protein